MAVQGRYLKQMATSVSLRLSEVVEMQLPLENRYVQSGKLRRRKTEVLILVNPA